MLVEDRLVSEIEYYEAKNISLWKTFCVCYRKKRTIKKGYIAVLRFVVIDLGDKLSTHFTTDAGGKLSSLMTSITDVIIVALVNSGRMCYGPGPGNDTTVP